MTRRRDPVERVRWKRLRELLVEALNHYSPYYAEPVDVHLPPGRERDDVWVVVDDAREALRATCKGIALEAEAAHWSPGGALSPSDPHRAPLRRAFERVALPWGPSAFRSHSDAGLFVSQGSRTVVCGPGDLGVAHTRQEHVSLAQVEHAARLYAALIAAVAGPPSP